jgi:activated CDC42 kinase 1
MAGNTNLNPFLEIFTVRFSVN